MTTQDKVYQVVRQIPLGQVLTYKDVATRAHVKNPRIVGHILHRNPDPATIPCHRVVNWQGKLSKSYAFGGLKAQAQKLRKEGIKIKNGDTVEPTIN